MILVLINKIINYISYPKKLYYFDSNILFGIYIEYDNFNKNINTMLNNIIMILTKIKTPKEIHS